MAAVTKAKEIYTTRKGSLIRLLDPIPQLTQGGAASIDRLIEHRKECKIVWEQFVLAHEELVQVRPEDEDPDAAEFGALENRKNGLLGTLAEAIGSLNVERLSQDKRAEEERAQQDDRLSSSVNNNKSINKSFVVFTSPISTLKQRSILIGSGLTCISTRHHLLKSSRCVSMCWQTRGPP